MAFSAGTILAKLRLEDKQFTKAMGGAKKSSKGLEKSTFGLNTAMKALAAGGLLLATKQLVKFAESGGRLIDLGNAFRGMAKKAGFSGDVLLDQTKKITQALTNREIMTAGNTLEALGVGMENLPKFTEIARAAAIALGKDVGMMLESISVGTARQSRLWLDNLGIIISLDEANQAYARTLNKTVSQLSDAEKKQAFLNAVLEKGEGLIKLVGSEAASAAEPAQELAAAITDLKDALAALVAIKLGPFMNDLAFRLRMINDMPSATKKIFGKLLDIALFREAPQEAVFGGPQQRTIEQGIPIAQWIALLAGPVEPTLDPFGALQARGFGGLPGVPTLPPGSQDLTRRQRLEARARGFDPSRQGTEQTELFGGDLPVEGIEQSTEAVSELVQEVELADMAFSTLGNSIEAMFTTLMTDSDRAGRVFAAAMLGSIGQVASNMGDLYIATAIGGMAMGALAWPLALAAGFALKAIGGTLKGIGQKQVPPIVSPRRLSPEGLRERDTMQGSLTINVQGDFMGEKFWIDKLAEKLRRAQRDRNVELNFT